tara:strand:- start:34748 stop:35182 length:435 start_codon:yes stop_codon:yes gene_type:complete
MNSRLGKIINYALDKNKDDFSSLLREEIEERVNHIKKSKYPELLDRLVFSPKDQQTLNISEEEYAESIKIIPLLNELANKKGNVSVTFSDNSETVVTSKDIDSLIKLHDALNEENQVILRSSLVESKESFKSSANFAKKYTRKG